ncbi:hypothetical protein GCM10009665_67690 [Kitasatospora nipponensis]|uniref:Uncharacterized protein n=1 Tax=Kitasatospora nipponensis TaxID=258049 RepID=A0ABN1WX79_9ACTN
MDLDQELAHVFRAGVADLTAPVAAIAAESGRLGRRRLRLRRLRAGGAVLTVVAVAWAGALVVRPHGRPTLVTDQPVPSATAGPTAAASPTTPPASASASARASDGPPDVQLTSGAMVKLLADRLPSAGTFLKYQNPYAGGDPAQDVGAFLRYDDGHGIAAVQLTLSRITQPFPTPGSLPGFAGAPVGCELTSQRPSDPPPGAPSCDAHRLADGSWEWVEATDATVPGLYGYQVLVWHPDGYLLVLSEYAGTINASGHKEAATRQTPPFTLDQWRALAEDPGWQPKVPQALVDEGSRLTATIPNAPFSEG